MNYIYEPSVQKLIDAINKQVYDITLKHKEAMDKELAPLHNALMNIKLKNPPIKVELTDFDKMEIEQMNKELNDE